MKSNNQSRNDSASLHSKNIYYLVSTLFGVGRIRSSFNFLKLVFAPCKAEQSLQGLELQEKEAQRD